MLAFGLGTLPNLLLLGYFAAGCPLAATAAQRLAAGLVIGFGVLGSARSELASVHGPGCFVSHRLSVRGESVFATVRQPSVTTPTQLQKNCQTQERR
jgi:hypothetical protein